MLLSPGALNLRLEPPKLHGETVRLEGRLIFPDGRTWEPWFEFTCPDPAQARINPRPFLLAAIPMAMRHGLDLRCEHGVDPVSLRNLRRWMDTFAGWIPRRLRRITLDLPESPCLRGPGARGTIQPFSGGVDSTHTLLSQPRDARHAGLMVHGFDIPLADAAGFAGAWANSAAALHACGAEAYRLRTNLRERTPIRPGADWETEAHGIWLAAALACLEPWFDEAIIPSTFCLQALATPWGSHPQTDPLLGSAAVPYHHHGAELDKLGKVAELVAHPGGSDRLRVCWQTGHAAANCGHCFKCSATQVCLWLSGVPHPAAFPDPCEIRSLARLPIKPGPNRYLVTRLESVARAQGRADLAEALAEALARSAPRALPGWLSWLRSKR